MKFLHLILAALLRRKIRTVLTLGSFMVALFLFGVLATVRNAMTAGIEVAGVDRLAVINKISLIMPLPLSYRERILQLPGVAAISYSTWFGGIYQNEANFFPQFAIDKDTYFDLFPEYLISEEQKQAFMTDKQACIAGESLAKRFNWQVGDRIPLKGTIWEGFWEFNLVGIYKGKRATDDTSQFWFRFDYLEDRKLFEKGTVGWYVVKIKDPDLAVSVVKAIDERFANSPYETSTQTERAFAAAFMKQMGNIELLLLSIGTVVFFTLLLVTGNTMAIAVRERTNELAVLKAIGFSDLRVLGLVLAESLTLAIVGGTGGLILAKLFTLGGDPTGGMLPVFILPLPEFIAGVLVTIFVGLLAGLLPALSAMRLRVVEALRRI